MIKRISLLLAAALMAVMMMAATAMPAMAAPIDCPGKQTAVKSDDDKGNVKEQWSCSNGNNTTGAEKPKNR